MKQPGHYYQQLGHDANWEERKSELKINDFKSCVELKNWHHYRSFYLTTNHISLKARLWPRLAKFLFHHFRVPFDRQIMVSTLLRRLRRGRRRGPRRLIFSKLTTILLPQETEKRR